MNPGAGPRRSWSTAAVIALRAVVEVPTPDPGTPWPVAAAPSRSWLALDGECTDDQVGLFVAAAVGGLDVPPPGGRDEIVDRLLSEETLFIQGGLRLHDAETGALVVPSCCNGLADWLLVSAGLAPSSFGHDPDPQIEYVGDSVRVWPDGVGNRDRGSFAGEPVDLPRATLGTLLCAVRTDLVGFLTAVAGWTDRIGLRRPRAGTGGDDRPPVRDLGTLGPGRLATPHQILNRHAPGPPLGQDPSDRRRSPAGSMVGAVPVAAEATTGRRRSPAGSMVGAVPVAGEADHRSAAVSGRLSGRRCSSRGRGRPRPRVAPRVGGRRPCRRGPGLRVAPAPPRRPRRRARRGPGAASGTVGRPP